MYINEANEKIIFDSLGVKSPNDFFTIQMSGVTNPNPDYRHTYVGVPDALYGYYVFEYVVSGVGYIEMNDEKLRIEAGDFYYYHKYAKLSYHSDRDDPYKKLWVNARGACARLSRCTSHARHQSQRGRGGKLHK